MTSAARHAPAELLAGRFRLGDVLGRGGMATVWSAHDTRLDRTVAVKILHDHLTADDEARIEREARAAARVTDPRVVTVLDLDHTEDGTPFLVFEALSGRTLADEIREHGALPADRAERLADDLLGALAAAHGCGVLHRDIKPSNVLVDGPGFRVTDFGIASVDDETATKGDLIGTLGYVAPERFDGAPATPQSDVFAAAAVLYEAVTGEQPFRAATAAETIERIRSGEHAPLPASAPPHLRETITHGLDPDPTRRPTLAPGLPAPPAGPGTSPTPATDATDATERLDVTEHLPPPASAPSQPVGPPSAVPVPGSPVRRRIDELLDRPAVSDAVERAKKPQSIFVTVAIVLLLLLLFAATRDSGERPAEGPTTDPAVQLDRQLDRIEEIG